MNSIKLKIKFIEDILGSLNNNPNIFDEFQSAKLMEEAAKAGSTVTPKEAEAKLAEERPTIVGEMTAEEMADDKIEKQTTVFPRNTDKKLAGMPENARFSYDYQWRGFFKEALQLGTELKEEKLGILSKWTVRKAVDSMVFLAERRIPFLNAAGEPITEVKLLERPLRAMTQRGERICLARSEIIPAGATASFTLKWLESADKKSKQRITREMLLWALDYGCLKGFGQWRGGGFGRFEYEIIETDSDVKIAKAA